MLGVKHLHYARLDTIKLIDALANLACDKYNNHETNLYHLTKAKSIITDAIYEDPISLIDTSKFDFVEKSYVER